MAELDLDLAVEGRVLLDGCPVEEFNVAALRRQVGMVFSVPTPLPMTVYENLVFGISLVAGGRDRFDEQVEKALRAACLWDEMKDRLNEPARNLSGGSSSGSARRARWPWSPGSCCWTNPVPASTRSRPRRSSWRSRS